MAAEDVRYDLEFHFADGDVCLIYDLTEEEARQANESGRIVHQVSESLTEVHDIWREKLNYVKTIRRIVKPEASKVIA